MNVKVMRDFVFAIVRNRLSVFSCIAVILCISLSFWTQNDVQIRIFSLLAIVFLFLGLSRAWAAEYVRAEKKGESRQESRPRVSVDEYFAVKDNGEQDEEYLVETLRISNKGDAPAIGVSMRPIQLFGRTARLFASIPNLEPGETKEIRILNLRHTLERAAEKATKSKGHALFVRLPMTIEYRDAQKERWIAEHIVLSGVDGVSIDIVRANKSPEWTSFSSPKI
jgi:hypothetical protein